MKRRQGVGLAKTTVRRGEGERFGIVFRSEREVESVSKELTRELRSATEAVYDPRLCGFPFTAESDDFRVGSDDMEQEGFAPEFTQFKMQVKQVGLETDQACSVCNVEVRVVRILPQRVKAAFANGFDLRLGYKGAEEAQVGRGNASGVPGVDADRIAVAGAQKRYGLKIQLTRKRAAGSPMIYGIKIDEGVAAQDVGVDIEIHSLSGYRIIA